MSTPLDRAHIVECPAARLMRDNAKGLSTIKKKAQALNWADRTPRNPDKTAAIALEGLRAFFVTHIYANHNHSPSVRRAIESVLVSLASRGEWGLDAGAGGKRLHPRLLTIDLARNSTLDCIASVESLPFAAASLALVVSQEVVEHVRDPWRTVAEAARVLRPGGKLYMQTPFVIGYHPCPRDYWRFTADGLRQLIESAGFEIERLESSVGAGTGMYRITVEFWAALAAALWGRLYLPAKALAAVFFRPLCCIDRIGGAGSVQNRIAGGYFAIAVKKTCVC